MKYELKDGGVINASTPGEFLTNLRKSSRFDSDCSDEQYMKNFAERFKIQTGTVLDTSSPEAFVEGLQKAKFIVPVS